MDNAAIVSGIIVLVSTNTFIFLDRIIGFRAFISTSNSEVVLSENESKNLKRLKIIITSEF